MFAFQPAGAQGTTPTASTRVVVATAVQQLTLPLFSGKTMRLVNEGTSPIAWSYGVSSGLTLANGTKMLPNTIETFTLPSGITQLSVVADVAGSIFTASVGEGT